MVLLETSAVASLDFPEVKHHATIDPQVFIELVREPLQRGDTVALAHLINQRWSHDQIMDLLESRDADARKLAALALGFVGDVRSITALAACLRDPDPMVNQMAEHALWTVWFRAGSQAAQERVQLGSEYLSRKQLDKAIQEFSTAIRLDPTYAEARNQRAIAYYLSEDYYAAIDDGEMVVKLMPSHFGAWSGLGHSYAHLGHTKRALCCYRRALGINPYLHCVRQIINEIQAGQCICRIDHVA